MRFATAAEIVWLVIRENQAQENGTKNALQVAKKLASHLWSKMDKFEIWGFPELALGFIKGTPQINLISVSVERESNKTIFLWPGGSSTVCQCCEFIKPNKFAESRTV